MKVEIRIGVTGAAGEVWVQKSTESASADEVEQCDTAIADLAADFESLVGGMHPLFNTALVKYRPRWDKWKAEYDKIEAEKAAKLEAVRAKKAKEAELARKEEEAALARAATIKAMPRWNGLPDPVPNWPAVGEKALDPAPSAPDSAVAGPVAAPDIQTT